VTDHPQLDRADRDLLFVSYSHRDGVWAQRFDVMLKPLVRRQRLQLWIDSTIRAGATWQPEIEQAIRRSRLALLLVSADYLASDFIMDDELPTLIRHGVTLAPVLVGDCMWQHVPELAAVQWLHDPDADGALGLHADPYAEAERDRRIRLACERLVQVAPTEPEPVSDRLVEAVAVAAAPTTEATVRGALSQVPPLPPGYVVRDELDAILDQVIGVGSGGAVGLTAPAAGLGLQGIGGIGKTVLAIALVRDDRIRNRFPDGVY